MFSEFNNLEFESRKRWNEKTYLEDNKLPYSEESTYLRSIAKDTEWVPYEDYIFAKLIAATPGQIGLLHIQFPPEMAKDSKLHTHIYSDRLITVIDGAGTFIIAKSNGTLKNVSLKKGNRLWMPRGVRHTFVAGKNGLTLESIHNPFFSFDDPDILTYDYTMEILPTGIVHNKSNAMEISHQI